MPDFSYVINKTKRKKKRRRSGAERLLAAMGPILYFPMMFFYLEFVFHIYMGLGIKYLPVWLMFSVSMGFFVAFFATIFGSAVNKILTYVFTVVASVAFVIELMTKKVLASYYQLFSIASTAVNNKLSDYKDAIFQSFFGNIVGVLLLLLPVFFIFIVGRKFYDFRKKWIGLSGLVLGVFLLMHLIGILVIRLPWRGDYTPSAMYTTDTNVEDQVKQLGVITMLRLDLKHSLFGVKTQRDDDFESTEFTFAQTDAADEDADGVDSEEVTEEEVIEELTGNAALFTNTDTSANVMDIELEALAESASSKDLSWLLKFFASEEPTYKNEYTGAFEGYNVIYITAEGFTGYAIDEELTPTLYRLSNEGFVFTNYYTALHYTSTTGGECQNLLGLYPKNGGTIIMQESGNAGTNWYFSLAQQLNRLGYLSLGYHANGNMYNRLASHTNLGYNWIQDGTGFLMETVGESEKSMWPQSDLYLIEETIDDYLESEDPFNVYYLTISGHMPYEFSSNAVAKRNADLVAETGYSDVTQGYLATVIELDSALEYLIEKLEEAGIADKTLIVLTADHIPYFNISTIEELAGTSFTSGDTSGIADSLDESVVTDYNLYKNTLIMWTASMEEAVVVDKVCCQVDVLPTISNLLGLEYDSRMLSGRDILSTSYGLVAFNSGSWLTDYGYYDRNTSTFTVADGIVMTDEEKEQYVSAMKKEASNRRSISEIVLSEDAYEYLFPGTKNSSSAE